MTTIVGKGAGRPAAAARKAKHDQRNPQPSSHTAKVINDFVQSAPDSETAMATALDGNAYGRMTVKELRARAEALGVRGSLSKLNKGMLLNAILDAERKKGQSEPETMPVSPTNDGQGEIRNEDEGAPDVIKRESPANLNPKGSAKADKLATALEPHGWHGEIFGEGDKVTAVARRGGETITVVWDNGVYNYEESAHLVHDRNTRLRNVSAAIKLGARPKEAVEAEYGKVISNRRFRPAQTKASEGHLTGKDDTGEGYAVPADRRLWLDPEAPTDDELWAALGGYRVVWVNRVSNMTESATVSQNFKFFNVRHNPAGERMVEFCTVGFGFRACRVADIISTSRKAGKARRTKTLPGGEEVRAA